MFVPFPDSPTGHRQPLIRPPESHRLDYEGEIVVVIGRGGRRIPIDRARNHIAGLTVGNEGTILTGTPTGAGARLDPPRWLEPGEVVEVDVPGIGTLVNTVIDEPVSDQSTMDQAVPDHPSHTTPQVRPW